MADLISMHATDVWGFALGPVPLWVHGAARCAGAVCCIHAPSAHHMRSWPQVWRADRGLVERLCPHGTGHPDPDDLRGSTAVHTCDGCCGGAS